MIRIESNNERHVRSIHAARRKKKKKKQTITQAGFFYTTTEKKLCISLSFLFYFSPNLSILSTLSLSLILPIHHSQYTSCERENTFKAGTKLNDCVCVVPCEREEQKSKNKKRKQNKTRIWLTQKNTSFRKCGVLHWEWIISETTFDKIKIHLWHHCVIFKRYPKINIVPIVDDETS